MQQDNKMDEKKAIEDIELTQKIVSYLTSKGIDPMDDDFEKLVNLIKGWEDDRNMSDE